MRRQASKGRKLLSHDLPLKYGSKGSCVRQGFFFSLWMHLLNKLLRVFQTAKKESEKKRERERGWKTREDSSDRTELYIKRLKKHQTSAAKGEQDSGKERLVLLKVSSDPSTPSTAPSTPGPGDEDSLLVYLVLHSFSSLSCCQSFSLSFCCHRRSFFDMASLFSLEIRVIFPLFPCPLWEQDFSTLLLEEEVAATSCLPFKNRESCAGNFNFKIFLVQKERKKKKTRKKRYPQFPDWQTYKCYKCSFVYRYKCCLRFSCCSLFVCEKEDSPCSCLLCFLGKNHSIVIPHLTTFFSLTLTFIHHIIE